MRSKEQIQEVNEYMAKVWAGKFVDNMAVDEPELKEKAKEFLEACLMEIFEHRDQYISQITNN